MSSGQFPVNEPVHAESPDQAVDTKPELGAESGKPASPIKDPLGPPTIYGLVSFLLDAEAAILWGTLSILGYITLKFFINSVYYSQSEGIGQMAALLFFVMFVAVGLLFLSIMSVSGLAIVRDTANSATRVENWPGINILDWLPESFYVVNALFFSAMPGALVAQVLILFGAGLWLITPLAGLTAFFLFPALLLSLVISNSPINPSEPMVWRSLRSSTNAWKRFYIIAAVMAAISMAAFALMYVPVPMLPFCSAVLIVTVTLAYFRLLGRLLWTLVDEAIDQEVEEKIQQPSDLP